jgi:hypothetical protein
MNRRFPVPDDPVEPAITAVRAEWSALSPDLCRTLARSMPERLQADIEANGWHT